MKDERYEVRGKIGQGGVGAVYRVWDTRLNREVAIKRVLPDGNIEGGEEAIEHLLKEATALSSIQHPHIVTIYDAGVDEDGPYVVMELLDGRTLDEMVERGTLVMDDFREVAIQSQEALIAAQDLDLVHRDLKPTNVMVVWLPSGKFQIKIVDFGLAKFSASPSIQTIDHGDAVFGSIHFMAPEQFERTPLDQRTDMYAMGCLYYFTLTGGYPFVGESAPQVMTAHLQHQVTPLQDLRPDLPAWVCDWVMWHINRNMDDRPTNAREALQQFLMNEQQNPTPPEGEPKKERPKFVFPGSEEPPAAPPATAPVPATPVPATPVPATPVPATPAPAPPGTAPVSSQTAPQPIQPPEGQAPSVHTTSQVTASQPPQPPAPEEEPAAPVLTPANPPVQPTAPAPTLPVTPAAAPPPPPAKINLKQPGQPVPAVPVAPAAAPVAAPVAAPTLTPAAAAPPSVPARPVGVAPGAVPQATPAAPQAGAMITGNTTMSKSKGMSTAAKSTIAAVLGLAVIIVAFLVITKMGNNKEAQIMSSLLSQVEDPTANNIPTTSEDVDTLLVAATSIAANSKRQAVYQRLLVAESSDGTDIDAKVANFATNEENQMISDIRVRLFEVLQGRKAPSALPQLIEHARSTANEQTAAAALRACERIATDKNLADLLNIMRYTRHSSVRTAAKRTIASVAKRTDGAEALATALKNAYDTAPDDEIKRAYLELLGSAGGAESADIIRTALENEDKKTQLAAISALRVWPDDTMFEDLIDYAKGQEDDFLRNNSFGAAYSFLKLDRKRDEIDLEDMWKLLAREARTSTEKRQIIDGMAKLIDDWAFSVVEFFEEDKDDDVSFHAEKARSHMESRRKRIEGDDDDE